MAEEKKIKCPECGQTDAVQKLSIVYAEGMLTPSGESGVKELGPPAKPKFNGLVEKAEKGMSIIVGGTIKRLGCLYGNLVLFVLLLVPIVAWAYFCIWISFVIIGLPFDLEAVGSNEQTAIILVLMIIPPAILFYLAFRRTWRFGQEHLPPWLAAVEEWSKLFFCKRCNRTFASEAPIPLEAVGIDWSGLEKIDTKIRQAAEKAVKTFWGIANRGHCHVCHKEMNGILLSQINLQGLPASVKTKGFICPTCGEFYCIKCLKKGLNYNPLYGYATGFAKAVCSSCKSLAPKPDMLVETKGWYESFPFA